MKICPFPFFLLLASGILQAQEAQLVLDDPGVLQDARQISVRFYDHPRSTTLLDQGNWQPGEWRLQHDRLLLTDLPAQASADELWAEVNIDGIPLARRYQVQAITSPGVTFASGNALNMDGNPITGLPATPASADEAASKAYVDAQVGNVPAGDITKVTAGTGLSGGGDSGDVTLAIDSNLVQNRVSGNCPTGQSIRVIAADGSVTCEVDDDSIAPPAWQLGGNDLTGTEVLGSNNALPMTIQVNGRRTLQLIPGVSGAFHAPNILLGADTNIIGATFVGATIGGGLLHRANATQATIAGGSGNSVTAFSATIGGGNSNNASGSEASIGGGNDNTASGSQATIGGGSINIASGSYATIGGGSGNTASGEYATIGGGYANVSSNSYATVSGGSFNIASGYMSSISGGDSNLASGSYSAIPGGRANQAGGRYSFAAGRRAKVRDSVAAFNSFGDEGTFVWADSTDADFVSTGPDQFLIRASGGVGIGTNDPLSQFHVLGIHNSSTVARIENFSTNTSADTLHLFINRQDPAPNNDFIVFFGSDGAGGKSPVGAIEGDGASGVNFKSGSADFAEYLPTELADLQPGEVVALRQGKLWRDTRDAERLFVISTSPIITGNSDMKDDTGKALAAFTGQVPVNIDGPVQPGNWLMASGKRDGKAVAVTANDLASITFNQIVGQALETPIDGKVKALVGLPPLALMTQLQQQNQRLKTEIARLKDQQTLLISRVTAFETWRTSMEQKLKRPQQLAVNR